MHRKILPKRPIPSIREAFTEVRREESCRKVMMETHNSFNNIEATAFIIIGGQRPLNSWKQRKERPKCDHCYKFGHTKGKCWDFHGRSEDAKLRQSRSNSATSREKLKSTGTSVFNKKQPKLLQQLFVQQNNSPVPSIASRSMAHKGNILYALNVGKEQFIV